MTTSTYPFRAGKVTRSFGTQNISIGNWSFESNHEQELTVFAFGTGGGGLLPEEDDP